MFDSLEEKPTPSRAARRAARRRQMRLMEEVASGSPRLNLSAGSSPSRAASDAAQPHLYGLPVFDAAELDRYCCSVQTNVAPLPSNAPAFGGTNRSTNFVGDVIFFGGPGDDEEKFGDLSWGGVVDSDAEERDESIDFFPNFTGNYGGNERRATKPLGAPNQDVQSLASQGSIGKELNPSERDKKKCWLPLALLLSVLGITLASSLTARTNAGDDYFAFQVKNPKHDLTPARQTPTEASTLATPDLSAYGYPYAHGTSSSGWVTWIPGRSYKDINHVSYDGSDGISSLEDCAAKCQEAEAPTASWSGKYKTCWCNFSVVTNLCREPCVADEYIDFGIVPIGDMHYCKKSVCDKDTFLYDPKYCEVDVDFDQDTCDEKKEEIERASV